MGALIAFQVRSTPATTAAGLTTGARSLLQDLKTSMATGWSGNARSRLVCWRRFSFGRMHESEIFQRRLARAPSGRASAEDAVTTHSARAAGASGDSARRARAGR